MTDIDELTDEFEAWGGQQVFLDELGPDLTLFLAGLGIAIARKIDQVERFAPLYFSHLQAHFKEIDGLGLARIRRYTGKIIDAGKRIDQGGFSGIGRYFFFFEGGNFQKSGGGPLEISIIFYRSIARTIRYVDLQRSGHS